MVIELPVLLSVQQIIDTDIIEKGSIFPGHTSRLGISLSSFSGVQILFSRGHKDQLHYNFS